MLNIEKVEFLINVWGKKLFGLSNQKSTITSYDQFLEIEKLYNIKIPKSYKEFYIKYLPLNEVLNWEKVNLLTEEFSIVSINWSQNICFPFDSFSTCSDLKIQHNFNSGFNEEFKWDMIRIGYPAIPNSGICLGVGKRNMGKIYFIDYGNLPLDKDINLDIILPSQYFGIRYLSDDIFSFFQTLTVSKIQYID